MAIIVAKTREEIIQQVKDLGQTIINRAEDIVGDISQTESIEIKSRVEYGSVPVFSIQKRVYVHEKSEPTTIQTYPLNQTSKSSCHHTDRHGNPVSISFGKAEISPHNFILSEVHENCKVEILKCETCGEISIGWYES